MNIYEIRYSNLTKGVNTNRAFEIMSEIANTSNDMH